MPLEGDLSTLDLADLLQNFEQHRRTGTLTLDVLDLEAGGREHAVFFREGRIALVGHAGRADLAETLVDAGKVPRDVLEKARKRRRPKTLAERLVKLGAIEEEELRGIARARLVDEVCELVHSRAGEFRFEEGGVPVGAFDPEERALELAVDVEPLLLEAARRADHWALIRERIPTDSAHFILERVPDTSACQDPELAAALVERIDGTRCVREALAVFPHRRFEAYIQLSEWVERHHARLAKPEHLLELARRVGSSDRARAREILGHGLETHPQHPGLLAESAVLAEDLGDAECAVDALKMLAHLTAEKGDDKAARATLDRALGLQPEDTALWERALLLDLRADDLPRAREDGAHLAQLYRAPGLHRKALGVLERMLEAMPDDAELHFERARAQVDCSQSEEAVSTLGDFARRRLRARDEEGARAAYEAIVEIDPDNAGALRMLTDLENQVFTKRRRARRRRMRRIANAVGLVLVCVAGGFEVRARLAYSDAEREISAGYWIEDARYGDAVDLLEELRSAHPYALTTVLDMTRRIDDLRARQKEHALRAAAVPARGRTATGDGEVRAEGVGTAPGEAGETPLPFAPDSTFVPAPADAPSLLGED